MGNKIFNSIVEEIFLVMQGALMVNYYYYYFLGSSNRTLFKVNQQCLTIQLKQMVVEHPPSTRQNLK